jgi:hypothetical protein
MLRYVSVAERGSSQEEPNFDQAATSYPLGISLKSPVVQNIHHEAVNAHVLQQCLDGLINCIGRQMRITIGQEVNEVRAEHAMAKCKD